MIENICAYSCYLLLKIKFNCSHIFQNSKENTRYDL